MRFSGHGQHFGETVFFKLLLFFLLLQGEYPAITFCNQAVPAILHYYFSSLKLLRLSLNILPIYFYLQQEVWNNLPSHFNGKGSLWNILRQHTLSRYGSLLFSGKAKRKEKNSYTNLYHVSSFLYQPPTSGSHKQNLNFNLVNFYSPVFVSMLSSYHSNFTTYLLLIYIY